LVRIAELVKQTLSLRDPYETRSIHSTRSLKFFSHLQSASIKTDEPTIRDQLSNNYFGCLVITAVEND
jgi:hypothetical protein